MAARSCISAEALILVFTMLRTYVCIGPGAPCTSSCWRRKWKAPQTGTPPSRTPSNPGNNEATRVCDFELSDHWQANRDHYDNQKINGLTFPRVICSSVFTQKLDVEGCDALTLPVVALLLPTGQQSLASKVGSWS